MDSCFYVPDGFVKLEIFPSGNCIFDAFNYATDICFPVSTLRQLVHEYVKKHHDKFKDVLLEHDNFFENLTKDYIWDSIEGHVVWVALSEIFRVNIFILDKEINNVVNIGNFEDDNSKNIYIEFEKNHYNCYVTQESYQFKCDMLQEQYQDLIAIRNIETSESEKLVKQMEFEESEKLARRLQEEETNRNTHTQNTSSTHANENSELLKEEDFYYDINSVKKIELLDIFNGIPYNQQLENDKILIGFAQDQLNEELHDLRKMMK